MAKKSKPKRKKRFKLPKPGKFNLASLLGNVSLHWNYLEVQYHEMIHCYLRELPQDVASAIFNAMGSVQKASFFDFLIAKYETEQGMRDHLAHFRKMIQIVTDNRNVLQHSLPSVEPRFDYEGTIYKRNQLGKPIPYKASADDLHDVFFDIHNARGYAYELLALLHAKFTWPGRRKKMTKEQIENYRKWLAYIEKPPLPHKLVPYPLGSIPTAG